MMGICVKLMAAMVAAILVLSIAPSMGAEPQVLSKPRGSSIIMDPVGDTLTTDPVPPPYSDIKKAQVTFQAGQDRLVFSMSLAGVMPIMTSTDFIIYNWMVDTDLDGVVDFLATLCWTGSEWSSGAMRPGTSPFFTEAKCMVRGCGIQVVVGISAIEEELGADLTEFNWRALTKYAPGQGNNWDIAPNDFGKWGYWSSNDIS